MFRLSSITLYDVIWGTAVPVFSCLCICLTIVFLRELCQFLKNKKSVCDFFAYIMKCTCCIQHLPPTEPAVKGTLGNQNRDDIPEKVGETDENENQREAPLETVTTST